MWRTCNAIDFDLETVIIAHKLIAGDCHLGNLWVIYEWNHDIVPSDCVQRDQKSPFSNSRRCLYITWLFSSLSRRNSNHPVGVSHSICLCQRHPAPLQCETNLNSHRIELAGGCLSSLIVIFYTRALSYLHLFSFFLLLPRRHSVHLFLIPRTSR